MQRTKNKNDVPSPRTEFWAICCESGKKYSQIVCQKFHVSMAALDPTVEPTSEFVSLMVEQGGTQYLLCSLQRGSLQQVNLDLYFSEGEEITFSLKGLGTVTLSGFYVYDENESTVMKNNKAAKSSPAKKITSGLFKPSNIVQPLKGPSKETSSEDEESSEELETMTMELPNKKNSFSITNKMKKIDNTPKKIEISLEDSSDDDTKKSASKVKKTTLNNKSVNVQGKQSGISKPILKNKVSKAIVPEEDSSPDNDDEDDDSNEAEKGEDNNKLKTYATKRYRVCFEEESSSDEEYSSEENDTDEKETPKTTKVSLQATKKMKLSSSTPVLSNKLPAKASNKSIGQVIDLDDAMNSSIGHTPMPKKQKPFTSQALNDSLALKKGILNKTPKKDTSDEMDSDAEAASNQKSPLEKSDLNVSNQSLSSSKKKKKRKRKSKAGANDSLNETTPTGTNATKYNKKLPSGIEFDDIRQGNGLIAKKGKLVHVYYTGKLENNQVFDSRQQGSKPFSFQLGTGQVIKGWDLGLEGMKVGGKRRLKIPANLGYGNKQAGKIPPKSTLYFDVELKAVS